MICDYAGACGRPFRYTGVMLVRRTYLRLIFAAMVAALCFACMGGCATIEGAKRGELVLPKPVEHVLAKVLPHAVVSGDDVPTVEAVPVIAASDRVEDAAIAAMERQVIINIWNFEDAIKVLNGVGNTSSLTKFGTFVISDEMLVKIQAELDRLSDQHRNPSFLLLDLETGAGLAYHIDNEYYSASGVKVHNICAICYYAPSAFATYTEPMEAALKYSSNDAYEALFNAYNENTPNEWRARAHLGKQQWGRMYTRYTTRDNAKLWLVDWDYLMGPGDAPATMREWMSDSKKCAFSKVLGSREGYTVCSKAGWESGENNGCNEGGFIQTPGGTYLLVVMSSLGGYPDEVFDDLVEILDEAYQEYAPQKARR